MLSMAFGACIMWPMQTASIRLHRRAAALLVAVVIALSAVPANAQKIDEAARNRNHERLVELLKNAGPGVNLSFKQSAKQRYNQSAFLTQGLTSAESIEVVFSTTEVDTYSMNAYPKYKGVFININRAKDQLALTRQLLALNHRTFLHWGTDSSGDVFMGFTITLESGFPAEAIRTVLRSIAVHDKFIAELIPGLQ
jgi:hypothetical protein